MAFAVLNGRDYYVKFDLTVFTFRFSQDEGRGVWEMPSPYFSPFPPPRLGGIGGRVMSASCGEMFASDHGFAARMRAVPASSARWAAICRQNRRVSGYAKGNAAARGRQIAVLCGRWPPKILGDRRHSFVIFGSRDTMKGKCKVTDKMTYV